MLLDLLTVAVLAWFGTRLLQSFRIALQPPARARTLALVRGLRPRHFLPAPFVLAAVYAASLLLLQVPGLDFGWWTALGGQGNPAFGVTDRTVGTPVAVVVPILFMLLLVPALPLLVEREERIFRAGAEGWSNLKRLARAVLFGLVHAVIGIPIGVALALSLGGLWFTRVYLAGYRQGGRTAALLESVRHHLAYDVVIVAVVFVAFALEAVLLLTGSY